MVPRQRLFTAGFVVHPNATKRALGGLHLPPGDFKFGVVSLELVFGHQNFHFSLLPVAVLGDQWPEVNEGVVTTSFFQSGGKNPGRVWRRGGSKLLHHDADPEDHVVGKVDGNQRSNNHQGDFQHFSNVHAGS